MIAWLWTSLGDRYRALFSRRVSYTEFLPMTEEIIQTPPSPIRIALLLLIGALVLVVLLVSWLGKLDIYAVAQGRIQPVGRSKVVQPMEVGRIRYIAVRNGDFVQRGDLLVALDATVAGADQTSIGRQVQSLEAEIVRRRVAIAAAQSGALTQTLAPDFGGDVAPDIRLREEAVLAADLAQLSSALSVIHWRIMEDQAKLRGLRKIADAHSDLIDTLTTRTRMRQDLADQGWDSRASVLDAKIDLGKEVAAKAETEDQLAQVDAEIATYRRQAADTTAKFISENAEAISAAGTKLDQAKQDLVKASDKLRSMRLLAPISGTVQELAATTVGQVVGPGQQLLTVVPRKSSLEVVAFVQNSDIGFISVGQDAVIKVDAFPFTRYGSIPARVTAIARDAVDLDSATRSADTQQRMVNAQDAAASPDPKTTNLVFMVTLALDRNDITVDDASVPLKPGMAVAVEIKTGQRRIIDYLLSPVIETTSRTGHER